MVKRSWISSLLISLVENRHKHRWCLTVLQHQSTLCFDKPWEKKTGIKKAVSITGTRELPQGSNLRPQPWQYHSTPMNMLRVLLPSAPPFLSCNSQATWDFCSFSTPLRKSCLHWPPLHRLLVHHCPVSNVVSEVPQIPDRATSSFIWPLDFVICKITGLQGRIFTLTTWCTLKSGAKKICQQFP